MADTKFDVPIWHKTNLTVEEAAAYSGIGSQKLREMILCREQTKKEAVSAVLSRPVGFRQNTTVYPADICGTAVI